MSNLQKTNWFNLVAGMASLIGLPLAIYYGIQSHRAREPIFIETSRTIIIDRENSEAAPIKVIDNTNTEVSGNVVAIQFSFWNKGSEPIRFQEHVLAYGKQAKQEITISLSDQKSRILGFSCIKQSRPDVVNLQLKSKNIRELLLTFRILDKNDGGTCQIVFEGDKSTEIDIYGEIEGVPKGLNQDSSKQRIFSLFKLLTSRQSIFRTVIFLTNLTFFISKIRKRDRSRFDTMFIYFFVVSYSFLLPYRFNSYRQKAYLNDAERAVPVEIKP